MKSPCIGCNKYWYADRRCNCAEMCDKLKHFKEVSKKKKKMKSVISEEFDRLAEQTQINYLYCPRCNMFYLAKEKQFHNNCDCKELKTDPRD